jgi:hypothetical protein
MKKFYVVLLFAIIAIVTVSGATKVQGEAVQEEENPIAKFVGEYYVIFTNQDGEQGVMEEFVVDADGTIHGATEGSGLTSFRGKVNSDGSFTIEYTRLGGKGSGQFDGQGGVTGSSEVRGRTSTFSGHILKD